MSDRSGATSLEPDHWLAGLFGHPVFRVTDALDPAKLVEHLPRGDAFLFARVPAANVARVHALADHGLRVVDVTLRLTRDTAGISAAAEQCVREARASDYDDVLRIAQSAFRFSRFHLDPLVPRSLADAIKRAWMQSYRDGSRGAGCLVATKMMDRVERVVGFLGRIETQREGGLDVIDLIAVDERARGRGVGRALVEDFVRRAVGRASLVEVGTQAANVDSVRLYETCGFKLAGATYVLHGHFRDGAPR